ncbi:restriction endonuclease [Methanobacterium sp.]|uniref:restriction endonuclease n=1 Tax=Methanobacterium sp. TaxID=2164 RepID=UPI003C710411
MRKLEKNRLVDFVAKIMETSGFKVHKYFKTSKHLVDIYGVLPTVLGDIGVVVACKNYEERWKVGLDVLKEMEMVAKTLQASKVIVITTSTFSDNALSYANGRNISLINKDELMNIAKSLSNKKIETNKTYDDDEEEDNDDTYVLPSDSTGSSFLSRGRRGSLTGKKRNISTSNTSNKAKAWGKTLVSNPISLIIIVLAVSTLLTYLIHINKALLGILRIFIAAVLSYGIVMAVERNVTVTLIRGSTVFFVTLIIYIALILLT